MTVVTARHTVRIDAIRISPVPGGETSIKEPYSISSEVASSNGTADGQVDEVWKFDGALNAAAAVTHDLQNLTQLDDDGGTIRSGISLIGVKKFLIKNTTPTSAGGSLAIGEAASDIWDGPGTPFAGGTGSTTGVIDLAPGDVFFWSSRVGGLVSATEKDLKVLATGANQTYLLELVGEAT